jgi:ferredoxin
MAKLSINQKKCAGCGLCTNYDPRLFKIDTKTFKAKIKDKLKLVESATIKTQAKKLEKIKEIIRGCPAQAIKISK